MTPVSAQPLEPRLLCQVQLFFQWLTLAPSPQPPLLVVVRVPETYF
ncbi:MAG: hypothetical protein KA774_14075 [Burkholderiaceae bacterium]|nr:hypothetical protein [Burkholderiaceae bacterium]